MLWFLTTIFSALTAALFAGGDITMLRRAGYSPSGFFRAEKRDYIDLAIRSASALAVYAAVTVLIRMFPRYAGYIVAAPFATTVLIHGLKKSFHKLAPGDTMDARAFRLSTLVFFLSALMIWLSRGLVYKLGAGVVYLPCVITPLIVLAAGAIDLPVEMLRERIYVAFAKRRSKKLRDVVRIGVAGAYGRSNVIRLLEAMLTPSIETLTAEPESGSLIAAARKILLELDAKKRVFVCGMNSRSQRSAEGMSSLVMPRMTIVTTAFKNTVSNEASNSIIYKYVETLPKNGIAILPGDGDVPSSFIENCAVPLRLYGFDPSCDIRAEGVKIGIDGTKFELVDARAGERVRCFTPLAGRGAIKNLLAAAAAARSMRVSLDEIAMKVAMVQPEDGRMKLKMLSGGALLIDDSRGESVDDASNALETLWSFDGARFVATSGVRLPDMDREEENKQLGRDLAELAEMVVLVGRRPAEEIRAGLAEVGFPEDRVSTAQNMEAAIEKLSKIAKSGDVILAEGGD